MKRFFRRRWVAVAGAVLVLFLARPQAAFLRGKVSQSISRGLGRGVVIRSLHLRFLPRPGFVLDDVVIPDDPAFGAEPLVRAPEVTAWLRVSALLWGRLEISSLSLADASLNLTADAQGTWNVARLIDRAARVSTAPTSARGAQARPKFPYIEATQARINFKVGSEKTHFAFTGADFALWQETENAWSMRLRARPIRTDANLTDTGTVSLTGLWQRSAVLSQTPLQFSFVWNQAQIGQLSKLIYGVDKGWRGSVAFSGTANGTPQALRVTSDGTVDDFRRRDVLGGQDLRLRTHCAATYNSVARSLSNLDCVAPVGDGVVELQGAALLGPYTLALSSYNLSVVATRVPAQSALGLARHIRPNFTPDVTVDGTLNGSLEISQSNVQERSRWRGHGNMQKFELTSTSSGSAFTLGTVPFAITSEPSTTTKKVPGGLQSATMNLVKDRRQNTASPLMAPRLEVGPIDLNWNGNNQLPLEVRVVVSGSGYQASIRGQSELQRLLEAAHTLAIPAPAIKADGSLTVDLGLDGSWQDHKWPKVMGTAQLHSVYAQVRGTNTPLAISSATLLLLEDRIKVQSLNAVAAESHWRGGLEIPKPCPVAVNCQVQFNLHTPELNAAALNRFLNPGLARTNWYRFLSLSKEQPPYLIEMRALGRVAVDSLVLGELVCSNFEAELELDGGNVSLGAFAGEFLGGKVSGEVTGDFTRRPPDYRAAGDFTDVSLAQVSELMHDRWVDGTGNAHLEITTSGRGLEDLLNSAELEATFTIRNGVFPHIVLSTVSGPLRATRFSGMVRLEAGQFSFQDAQLEIPSGVYKVSGTALMDGRLDLKLAGEAPGGYNLSGTLVKTRVTPISTAQASLKP